MVSAEPLYILSGSFRSISLFLLAFSPVRRTLEHVQTIDGYGPHQYLATNPDKSRAYTTSWAEPPFLYSWEVLRGTKWSVKHVNSAPITAVSSYISIPSPYTHVYSAGGPTGEVHLVDQETGGFSSKSQQILFVPEDQLEKADKTRAALRYGSHAIEFSQSRYAFVPVLGTNSIEMYKVHQSGNLTHVFSSPSLRPEPDGPRHVKIHPNGRILYCVTEHANTLDIYDIHPDKDIITFHSSRSLLPSHLEPTSHAFRGDTLLLHPGPSHPSVFATTRGGKVETQGWISVFNLTKDGYFFDGGDGESAYYHETPTSGGKANAIDLIVKSTSAPGIELQAERTQAALNLGLEPAVDGSYEELWVLLTDDSPPHPGVYVLEWTGAELKQVAAWPGVDEGDADRKESMQGASHAIWLA